MYRKKGAQQQNHLLSRRFFIPLLSIIVLFLLTACSGGTVGTSSTRPVRISGKVVNESGEAVSNVDVTVLETGDSGRTDESGQFEIQSEAVEDEASLILESSDFSSSVVVGPLQEESEVRLDLVISESGQVTVASLTVRPLSTPGDDEEPNIPVDQGEEDDVDAPNEGDSSEEDPSSFRKGYSLVTGSVEDDKRLRLSGITVELRQDGLRLVTTTGERGRFSVEGPLKVKDLTITLYKNGEYLGRTVISIPRRSVHAEITLRVTFADEDEGVQNVNNVQAFRTVIRKRR